jgi:hypothetical protein
MNLEITKDERILILRCLFAETPLHDPEVKALANRLMELRENGHSTQGLSAVTEKGDRSQAAGQDKHEGSRAERSVPAQTPTGMSYMSAGKYDRDKVEQIRVTPLSIDRQESTNGPYLKLSWTGPGRGMLYASVFDVDLFPHVLPRLKQESVFYVVRKGRYLNVVGVKG